MEVTCSTLRLKRTAGSKNTEGLDLLRTRDTQGKVLDVDFKGNKPTKLLQQQHSYLIPFRAYKQTLHNRDFSSQKVSPHCITRTGIQGEVHLSRHNSTLGHRRACDAMFLPLEIVAGKLFV